MPAFAAAGAHLIVSSLQRDNDPSFRRDEAWRVTCVAAALADMLAATGVYWATADTILSPKFFIEAAREAGPDSSPFDLWVATDFYPSPDFARDKTVIARTNGFDAFIGREIECGPVAREPGEIGPIVRMVGHYMLDRKVAFQGGETIGTDESPMGRIQLDQTATGVDGKAVYRVALEEAKNG